MAETSKIEWTDATWNPITGCTIVSEGCRNCYAARLAATRLKDHPSRAGLARVNAAGEAKFTGAVRLNQDWLDQPLRWKRSRRIFVCAHGDLFHEGVADEWIDRIFAVMALAHWHTFQVLTKRPERMRAYMNTAAGRIADTIIGLRRERGDTGCVVPLPHISPGAPWWPLPNVWLGVSVEDQATADERIPPLLDTPAAIRFVSAEPLLGEIDLERVLWFAGAYSDGEHRVDVLRKGYWNTEGYRFGSPSAKLGAPKGCFTNHSDMPARLDWVIVGGESGPGARPIHPDWARSLRDQCKAAGVAFHFKQWGEWLPFSQCRTSEQREAVSQTTIRSNKTGDGSQTYFGRALARHADGHLVTATTPGIRPEQINRVGKARAGRLLDGVTHEGFPESSGGRR